MSNNVDVPEQFISANYPVDQTQVSFSARLERCVRPGQLADIATGQH